MPDPSPPSSLRSTLRWFYRVKGVALLGGAVLAGLFAWLSLGLLADVARYHEEGGDAVAPFVTFCIERRALILAPAALAAGCGAALLTVRSHRWAWLAAGMLGVLLIFTVVLTCFLMLIGPLYSVQPL